ncbi:sigma factor-like helix-turn-helix DNA-binding protein [Dactylosporangium sp. CA-092794]|uniref:sigma factor-like helix-turn-helix DNA-binding protein n=1 Tax=Dactylosporangium sp. CA-092794 TaxID=3239929 RepID=UPI003D8E4F8A
MRASAGPSPPWRRAAAGWYCRSWRRRARSGAAARRSGAILIELYFHGHSTDEAALHLGIPDGTVKSRAHYALRSLRAAIGALDVA